MRSQAGGAAGVEEFAEQPKADAEKESGGENREMEGVRSGLGWKDGGSGVRTAEREATDVAWCRTHEEPADGKEASEASDSTLVA